MEKIVQHLTKSSLLESVICYYLFCSLFVRFEIYTPYRTTQYIIDFNTMTRTFTHEHKLQNTAKEMIHLA